jgi:tripartite-type tricarboxylate transporter receptor subunit TctC
MRDEMGPSAQHGVPMHETPDPVMRRAAAALIAAVALVAPVRADDVGDFYKGRTINLIVGYGPSGGYDLFARMMARHLGRHIPGSPTIVVQNMPGAGSLRAANYLYAVAPRDGATIGLFARDMPLLAILGVNRAVAFDPRKFTWLGSASDFTRDAYLLMVRSDAPAQSVEAARRPGTPPLALGGTALGAAGSDVPIVLRDTLGINVRVVEGYPDSGAIFLAVDRGELDGRTVDLSSMRSLKPDWLGAGGSMHALVQFARATRHPDFPDVPTARELARNDKARMLIEFSELSYRISRPFAAPPGVPPARANALQEAFLAVQHDPSYQAEAARLRLDVTPIGSGDVLDTIDRIAAAPSDVRDDLRRLMAESKGK